MGKGKGKDASLVVGLCYLTQTGFLTLTLII